MLNFGQNLPEKTRGGGGAIPHNTLVFAIILLKDSKMSQTSGGLYYNIHLKIDEGQPFGGRIVFDKLCDVNDANNSEVWREMCYSDIRRILESARNASPDNPNSYGIQSYHDLNGLRVPIRILEKPKKQNGNPTGETENQAEYLSPHSSDKLIVKCYNLLLSGVNKYEKDGDNSAAKNPTGQGNIMAGRVAQTPPMQMPVGGGPVPSAAPQQHAPADAAPGWMAQQPQGGGHTGNQGFTQQPEQPAGPAVPQQPPQAALVPSQAANPAQTFPSNQGTPAQFPGLSNGN